MSDRQKGTENYSMPRAKRRRKPLNVTLSEAAMEAIEALAAARGESRSQVIEAEVLRAHARLPKLPSFVDCARSNGYHIAVNQRTPIDDLTRAAIIHRDGGKCVYCLSSMEDVGIEIDHLVAVARGGTNHPKNLVTSCHDCNHEKGEVHLLAYIYDRQLMGKNHLDVLPRIEATIAKPLDLVAAILAYLGHVKLVRASR
jgi:hypothetical protein